MTEFYIPKMMRGKAPDGWPYTFFRGIHAVPDSLANHGEANKLGIKPVEEITDAEWAGLALDKAKWFAARDEKLQAEADAKAKADASNEEAAKATAQASIGTALSAADTPKAS